MTGDPTTGDKQLDDRSCRPLPSSLGLSVLLPADGGDTITIEVGWGEYALRSTKDEITALCRARGMSVDKYLGKDLWERVTIPARPVALDLCQAGGGKLVRVSVPDTAGVQLEYRVETITPADADVLEIGQPGLGARALSVFLVNTRAIAADPERDGRGFSRELNGQTLFQVALRLGTTTSDARTCRQGPGRLTLTRPCRADNDTPVARSIVRTDGESPDQAYRCGPSSELH